MKEKVPISVVVITKDEEQDIADCLSSVSWAAEIIVVDDFSRDRTVEIAKQFTDRVLQRRMDIEGVHRNWAYNEARYDWVLSLDGDERVTPELAEEIAELLNKGTGFSAFTIPLHNYIAGHWVRYGGWYPASKLRLFKKDKFRYEEVGVHPRAYLDGECGHLTKDIIHKGYPTIAHFLDSLNRQTTLEAQKWVQDKRGMNFWLAMRKAHDRFFKTFFLKQGFRDGFIGWVVAFFAALYQFVSYAKYWELKQTLKDKC